MAATARVLADRHERIAIIGAGEDGDFRCEDQMAAAHIGAHLLAAGFECENPVTAGIVQRWADVDLDVATWGKSAAELKALGRGSDVDFIVRHADDLDVAVRYEHGALSVTPAAREQRRHARARPSGAVPVAVVAEPLAVPAMPVH
jgi:phosphosulfolactate phosphohydrolase-like enzyme